MAGVVFQGAERPALPVEPFLKSLWAAAWLIVAAISVGIAVPLLFRVSPRDTATIAVELIVKNTLLGIVLVSQAIDFDALIPIFGFASIQAPIGIGVIILWRALDRRGVLGSRATWQAASPGKRRHPEDGLSWQATSPPSSATSTIPTLDGT